MSRFAFLTFVVLATIFSASAADRRIAFERNNAVQIANLNVSGVRNLTNGVFPAISPNGRSVAFTRIEGMPENSIRRLAVADISSSQNQTLAGIPGENSNSAAWSPDGTLIAFTLWADGIWNLGSIKADGSDFRFIKKGQANGPALYSPCWARDGKSIFCHDLANIYRLALDGSILGQWRIDRLMPNGSMSGDGRIDVSPDGNRLLLSIDMDEEYDRKDWDGPVPALWSFDLSTGAAVRLTSRNLFAWDGCWLDGTNVLFVSQNAGGKQTVLYRTEGKNLKRLIENARWPTVSRP